MKSLKEKLNSKELTIGSWITLAHPAIAEIMARSGFDWLAVDLEHSVITIGEAEELIRIVDLCGVTPLVRLTSNDSDQIKRVMDAGAHGVIVPMTNNKQDAECAVAAVHYPGTGLGKRGVGLARAQGYGTSFKEYQAWLKRDAMVIALIEQIEAVNNIDEIFSVPGIDAFFIGPYDLSSSLGVAGELDHPDVVGAINKINEAGKKHNIPGGIHVVEPDTDGLKQKVKEGFKFIAYSVDTRMLDVTCRDGIKEAHS